MRTLSRTFLVFCTVGLISSLIDIAVLYTLVEFIGMSVLPSAAVGVLVASINGYILNKLYTYNDPSKKVATQYVAYLFVSLVGLALTLLLLKLFIEWFGLHYLVAKVFTIVLVTSWNFTINSLFVFTKTPNKCSELFNGH